MINNFVLYADGCYGVFIDWCLNNLTKPISEKDFPFNSRGSSHKHWANMLIEITNEPMFSAVGSLCHHQQLFKNNPHIANLVCLVTDENNEIWRCCNYIEKEEAWSAIFLPISYQDGHPSLSELDRRTLHYFGRNDLLSMERWQAREMLSFNILEHFKNNVAQQNLVINSLDYNKLVINITSIRDAFAQTIQDIFEFCNLKLYDPDFLPTVETAWQSLQRYKMLPNGAYKPHTLLSEAVIQAQLRQQGLELRCYNLNNFPNTRQELLELCEKGK
jgi:hypothetical protein